MNLFAALRRHPILVTVGLVLTGVALWIGHFLATFDLDHYRDQLAGELGRRLQVPVRLGAAQLELREAGIAFRFSDLQVGTQQSRFELQADKLWLQLAWHGLLLGRPILTEVALDAPNLHIRPPYSSPSGETAEPEPFRLESLAGLLVRRVEINKGSIDFDWRYPSGTERTLSLDDISLEIADLAPGRTAVFDATGNLAGREKPARLALNGSVDLPASGELAGAAWDLVLESRNFGLSLLTGLLPEKSVVGAGGSGKLTIAVKGRKADGLTVQVDLGGTGLHLTPGPPPRQPMPFTRLQATGVWRHEGDLHRVQHLAVQLDDLRITGEFSLSTNDSGHHITGRLDNSTLPLDTLRYWVPSPLRTANPLLSRRLPGGLLELSEASFRAELPSDPQGFPGFFLDTLRGQARGLSWDLGAERKAVLESLRLHFENNRWHLEQGRGTIAGLPATISATLAPRSDGAPQFSVYLTVSGPAEQYLAIGGTAPPSELTLAGELSASGTATGTTEAFSIEAEADLSRLDLRYGEQFHLPPTAGAAFRAIGHGTRTGLTIDSSNLAGLPFNGGVAGDIDWAGPARINATLQAQISDLASAYDLAPSLRPLELRGGLLLKLAASGETDALRFQPTIELQGIGVSPHGVIDDISQLKGRLIINGREIRGEKLTARIGRSPVILQARVADFKSPRLELGVKAAAIRADELIFRSDQTMLRDISGQLFIDRDGIEFAPVNVRLDGGTHATVRGSVKDFSDPRVELDISGEYANVEEIIGLWTKESEAAENARKARSAQSPGKPLPPIRIRAEARRGELFSMQFSNARALIVPTSGQLLIHPLDFNVEEGYCTTQALVDYSGKHSLLRVSGHVENVDAYEVVNELLGRKSIMRGELRGDFYLQGELGKGRFLPTSFGNINATVRNGVMRHSPVLSTIFSLLNVSQLFSFKLPDVNSEGVPFTRLAAELAIDNGVLSSDLVVIDSNAMNMSYVGQYDMGKDRLDLLVVVKPLGTIDKVVTSLPIAGWILGGEEKALITAQFKVTGSAAKPDVEAIPISAMSKGVLGIFQRTLSLPLKLIEDPAILWGGGGEKK